MDEKTNVWAVSVHWVETYGKVRMNLKCFFNFILRERERETENSGLVGYLTCLEKPTSYIGDVALNFNKKGSLSYEGN